MWYTVAMKQKLRQYLQTTSLACQLSAVLTVLMTVILVAVISIMTVRSERDIRNKVYAGAQALLDLQAKNTAVYFSQMDAFSLNPRNDVRFLKIITARHGYDYASREYFMSVVRNTYYQRDDLVSYGIYAVNAGKGYVISRANRNITERPMSDITSDPRYGQFSVPRYYRAVVPAAPSSGALLTYYRTIINIENGRPLAFVKFTVDTSWIGSMLAGGQEGALTALRNADGVLFYVQSARNMSAAASFLKRSLLPEPVPASSVKLGNELFLTVCPDGSTNEWRLAEYISKRSLDSYLARTRMIALAAGCAAIIASAVLLSLFTRVMVKPLSVLAGQLRRAGTGNFKSPLSISGCSEIASLSDEYNSMIRQIDELIQKNYAAELDWKNAQLASLESQINPHFLYNTLQTLSAEAIEHDQMKMNDMVMALSAMLKYTIRGPDTVTLRTELDHVRDYLFLQEARFGDRLTYEFVVDGDIQNLPVPKISVMTLVENSVIHGMSGTADSVRIEITAAHENGKLVITVTDDGNGIPEERLKEIQDVITCSNPHEHSGASKAKESGCLGLRNLSDRLKLMYGDTAQLSIYSTQYTGTSTVMEVQDV